MNQKAIIIISPVSLGYPTLVNHILENTPNSEIIQLESVANEDFISVMKDSVAFNIYNRFTHYYSKKKIRTSLKSGKIPVFVTDVYAGFHLKEYFKNDSVAILTKHSTLDLHKEVLFGEIMDEFNKKSISKINSQYYSDHLFDKTVICDDLIDAKSNLLTFINNYIK